METNKKYQFIGVDIGKDSLHIASPCESAKTGYTLSEIPNTEAAIAIQITAWTSQDVHIVAEYTGTYSSKLLYMIGISGLRATIITPNQSSAFAKMQHNITKNDKRDAVLLSKYGEKYGAEKPLFNLPDAEATKIRQILTTIDQLQGILQQVKNQEHAYQNLHSTQQQPDILTLFKTNIAHFETQIQALTATIQTHYDNSGDLQEQKTLITTVKSIGVKTADKLIAITGGLHRFTSAKQLAKFAGISPTESDSGYKKGPRFINKTGNADLRRSLYCATWSAIRFNKPAKQLYERLRAKGKPVKVCLIAVANLLLRQIFAVFASNKPFNNDYMTEKLQSI